MKKDSVDIKTVDIKPVDIKTVDIRTVDIKTALETYGQFVGTTVGVSMRPMIKSGKDIVVISSKIRRLNVYDVALYKRGEENVLHRVLEVKENGYVTRGDNCLQNEFVPEENVIGVLETYFKGKKQVDLKSKEYFKYVKRRLKYYPLRKFFFTLKQKIKELFGIGR